MDPKNTEFPIDNFRIWGFLFFLSGAAFHCIDFLGTEKTIEWAMGQFFFAAVTLTTLFWLRKAIKNKVWKFL